jgi:hypothetical protein
VCPADVRHTEKIKKNKEQGRRREIKKEERVTVHGDGVNRIGRMEEEDGRKKRENGRHRQPPVMNLHTRK